MGAAHAWMFVAWLGWVPVPFGRKHAHLHAHTNKTHTLGSLTYETYTTPPPFFSFPP
jgi:hypothetical protein